MSGSAAGTLTQSVALEVGRSYQLSFRLSGNMGVSSWAGCNGGAKDLRLWVGDQSWDYRYDTVPVVWEPHSVVFEATSATTPVTFQSLTPGYCGTEIDAVRLDPL
jgi:hypothetical protein